MKILLVSATHFEILPFLTYLSENFKKESEIIYRKNQIEIHVLVSSVGMVHTAIALGHYLTVFKPDLAINAGIAGALNMNLKVGDVVNVISEIYGDLGIEERDGSFKDVFETELIKMNQFPYINGKLYNNNAGSFEFLPQVKGLTVNKVHGSSASIEKIKNKYDADIETMEGAAFFLACLQAGLHFLAIRAVSNFVEPRDKNNWNIPLAIENLNFALKDIVDSLTETE
jgi:futalosine hydrolase